MQALKLEVEQKFTLTDWHLGLADLQDRLSKAGFQATDEIEIVDWYFDTADYQLCTCDCWLRYREALSGGQWELKRRPQQLSEPSEERESSAVYEEIEGLKAFDSAVSLVQPLSYSTTKPEYLKEYEDFAVPPLPSAEASFLPFARIYTRRFSWRHIKGADSAFWDRFAALSIDIDCTDYGYTVGEVELVAAKIDDVPPAQSLIRDFLKEMLGAESFTSSNSGERVEGKLECYLRRYRPELYQLLVDRGLM